ncbi:hypothetical protein ABT369_09935 [Dactylosporangium sp. NPDC000244]|uniref:hypothetical protein n=1 Tax=Dactylosporangium sp. NPDC000244 TaxID=3154365 RepID=UPI0033258B57
MSPLERRYRRLLRLLPADHRATRGEELLGLLLDLDEGRTRPSPRQSAGVLGLALRLRLGGPASLLLAAFLVAIGTWIAKTAYDIGTGRAFVSVEHSFPIHSVALVLLIPAVLRLAIAVAWILSARRTMLGVVAVLLAYQVATGGIAQVDVLAVLAVGVATALRWPAPRPRAVLLAAIPVTMLLWVLVGAFGLLGVSPLAVAVVVALLVAAAGRMVPGVRQRPTTTG